MKKLLHKTMYRLLLLVCFIIANTGIVFSQAVITVEPGFDTLLDALNANPGATLVLQRGQDYINDQELIITVPTIIKGETEPATTRPAVVSYYHDIGNNGYQQIFTVAANLTLQNIGMQGWTINEEQIGPVASLANPSISLTIDGCFIQGFKTLVETNANPNLTIIEKNNTFFNLSCREWDNNGGFNIQLQGDNENIQVYNNTWFIVGRALNASLAGPNGSQTFNHNTYCMVWGDLYYPIENKDLTVTNNICFNTMVRGYVGPRPAIQWAGDYSDWPQDSLCGNVPIRPHKTDTVGDDVRAVIVTNNLKMYDDHVLSFYSANHVSAQPFLNDHDYIFAKNYGWTLKNNLLQEKGNSVDPQFTSGAFPDDAYAAMFKIRLNRDLPADQQAEGYPFDWAWRPNGALNSDFIWPLPVNLKPLNTAIWHSASDKYPLGDLNWFDPDVRAAWDAKKPCPPLKGDVGVNTMLAPDFTLKNYPNPFNTSTLISYILPNREKVSLKVFTAAGNEVATLVDAIQSAGNYEVIFNRANLPNGIYFYKIQVGGISQAQKMVIVN